MFSGIVTDICICRNFLIFFFLSFVNENVSAVGKWPLLTVLTMSPFGIRDFMMCFGTIEIIVCFIFAYIEEFCHNFGIVIL